MLPIAVAAVLAVFLTTDAGRRWAGRLGVPTPFGRGRVDPDTRRYLLDACGGDRREMIRRVEAERTRFPALPEAELYRRAVRTVVQERGGPRDLDAT
jgi:hypothetical protein